MTGCATYTLNVPVIKLKVRLNFQEKLNIPLISDSFFLVPILGAFMFANHASYQNMIDLVNKFTPLDLMRAEEFKKQIVYMNPCIIYLYTVLEFYCTTYPSVRFNRRSNFATYTKLFTALIGVLYALACSAHLDLRFTPLLYKKTAKRFLMSVPDYMLINTIIINLVTFGFSLIPKRWYANFLTSINMACGIIALVYISHHLYDNLLLMVPVFILMGQFADLFDGRAAEKFGSTAHGELFDDVADFTSFALATGFLVFKVASIDLGLNAWVSASICVFYIFCIIFRLVRFVVNKRKAGLKTGVKYFEGMPSPGAAAVVIIVSCLFEMYLIQKRYTAEQLRYPYIAVVLFMAILADTKVKYAHPGRTFFKLSLKKGFAGKLMALYMAYFMICICKAIYEKNAEPALIVALAGMVFYLISPLFIYRLGLFEDTPKKEGSQTSDDEDIEFERMRNNAQDKKAE